MKWVVPHGDQQSARLDEFNPNSQVRVLMTPTEYLDFCAQLWKEKVREVATPKKLELLKDRLMAEEPLDCAFLDINVETWTVMAQEGRHRAIAAEALGLKEIPVILYGRSPKGWFVDEETHPGFAKQLFTRFGGKESRVL